MSVSPGGELAPDDTLFASPPVSRTEVQEVFQTWRNPSSIGQASDDSGLGGSHGPTSGGDSPTKDQKKKKKKSLTNKKTSTSMESPMTDDPGGSSSSPISNGKMTGSFSTGSLNNSHKLPKLGPSKSRVMMLESPPHQREERRRFINVVRPLSYFPQPALPPNYVLPVKTDSLYNSNQVNNSSNRAAGRPPSPAPFNRNQRRPANFTLAGNGYNNIVGGSSALRVNLAGGSGWDLTAIRRGYNATNGKLNGNYKSMYYNNNTQDGRPGYQGLRYQSQNGLDSEEKISMPPWNPHFGYSKVLSQQNLPLTDDWRRHIDARRKALQRRKARRRGVADGGTNMISNGDRIGAAQTDGNFEELLRRTGDVESSVQTEPALEGLKRKSTGGGTIASLSEKGSATTNDGSTQVRLDELPDFQTSLVPHVDELVNKTLEQAFLEIMEEEEIKAIRARRLQHQQMKMAELTTSRLMNVDDTN